MRRQHGFTLIELATVVAIIGVVAAASVVLLRNARGNATVQSVAFDLTLRLEGLRTRALAEQRDILAVLWAGDGGACDLLHPQGCARMVALAAPQATWTLGAFSPSSPVTGATELVDTYVFPAGIALDGGATGMAGMPPFGAVSTWDTQLTATCGSATCVAFRFGASGEVRGETPDGSLVQKAGHIVAIANRLEGSSPGADRRAVLVSFPAGIVKSYAY